MPLDSNPALRSTVPVLGVPDVRAAVDYFRDVLGFSCDPDTGVLAGVGDEPAVYGIVRRDDVTIHLQIRRRPVWAGERESIEGDVYFFVSDADALCAEFRARGGVIFRDLLDEPYGLRDFTLETPDGHRLTFGTPL